MAELSKLEREVLEALADQYAETRRGTRTEIVKAACNARNGKSRARVVDALVAMQRRGLVIGGPMGWVPTAEAVASLEGQLAEDGEPTAVTCPACSVHEGEYHDPECPAVNAFTAGRIQGDGTGQALPAIEYPGSVERLSPDPLPLDLLHRCAAMQMTLMADARHRYEATGCPEALSEIHWLAETACALLEAGGCHAE